MQINSVVDGDRFIQYRAMIALGGGNIDLMPILKVSDANPSKGEVVTLSIVVRNLENGSASNVKSIDFIPSYGHGTLYVNWTYEGSEHAIKVIVDPFDDILETNENNNEVSRRIPPQRVSSMNSFEPNHFSIAVVLLSVARLCALRRKIKSSNH